MIAKIVFILCALMSALCAFLLFSNYRKTRARLLFWSALCFIFLALNNVALIFDMILIPDLDLSLLRVIPALFGVGILIFGLIREEL